MATVTGYTKAQDDTNLGGKAPSSNVSANATGTANNPITNAAAARPSGLTKVFWQCSTQPTNWVAGDEWINNA